MSVYTSSRGNKLRPKYYSYVRLIIRPTTLEEANAFVRQHHRHHAPTVSHRWSIGVFKPNGLCGVAICGRPVARALDHQNIIEINRLATDGTKNACSKLYATCAAIARLMGFEEIETAILETWEEEERLLDLRESFPERRWEAPLIAHRLTHDACLGVVDKAGIVLPLMYRKGYRNANCIGCPKAGQNYWQRIREDFPSNFIQISNLQQEIGPGSYFLQFRSGPRKGERMALAELPPGRGQPG